MSNSSVNQDMSPLYLPALFGPGYGDVFSAYGTSFDDPIPKDTLGRFYKIIGGNYTLSDFQYDALNKLFQEFKNIQNTIDPNMMKEFHHAYNMEEDENELILWRRNDEKLINIIFHESDNIALSIVSARPETTSLEFFTLESDFEKMAYLFLS